MSGKSTYLKQVRVAELPVLRVWGFARQAPPGSLDLCAQLRSWSAGPLGDGWLWDSDIAFACCFKQRLSCCPFCCCCCMQVALLVILAQVRTRWLPCWFDHMQACALLASNPPAAVAVQRLDLRDL